MQRETTSVVERKKDTREKIILGGLVQKAGLLNANRAFLMGALLMIAKISPGTEQYESLKELGQKVLSGPKPSLSSSESPNHETPVSGF
ncbi:conjugal transfer protein TraD [Microvirga alba]|uniref:Conjugal transfer protein TraD n=1 Tax=Microvirga alba TaxID=2791025 RepID=A0A931BTC8_9HYPH|nr:conjugal transfer protein TraD [Microvirga alba]MBF9235618.1 conjugal transfer protein TraD [Microvirga alba]